ncbi:hypothetical protein [Caballeronia sp. LjRoot31]|uniref:hypothetical protein n=1 Tax=Caballeronia sp. LjRoot31 TaxID=3342324 RepID=UPI003ED134CF
MSQLTSPCNGRYYAHVDNPAYASIDGFPEQAAHVETAHRHDPSPWAAVANLAGLSGRA